jgi:hypothetical protein
LPAWPEDARRDAVDEQSFPDTLQVRQRFATQITPATHNKALELHAAEPISHHGLGDTENFPDSGLPSPDPVARMRGRSKAGNQRAVEVEERAYFGTC